MTSAYSINLNFNNTIPVKTDFTFKQGDKGITLNLATTGLDPTGTTAHIVFKRSNGTSVEAELTGQTGPSYSYTILGNEFEIPGVVVADLKLYNGDTQRVSTASFIFLVTGDTMDGVGGGTGGYSDQLEELSQEFSDTLEEYKDAFGDVGAVNPRGAYDSTEDYNVLDLVSYQGSSYLCRSACKNKVPTNTTYWQVFASGSGGVDYNDVSNKPSINSVTLSGNKTTEDLGLFSGDYDDLTNKPTIPSDFDDLADVDMAGVTDGQVPTWDATEQKYKPGTPAGGGGGTNPNLLINSWFTVNQRGLNSYTAGAAYTADRWYLPYSATLAISTNGATLSAGAYDVALDQIFESDYLKGKTVTLSIKHFDGTIEKGTVTFPTTQTTNAIAITNGSLQAMVDSSDRCVFRITCSPNSSITIRAVKLEIGSASTLHLDTAPDYTTELLKCQRYYYRLTALANNATFALAMGSQALGGMCSIKLPTEMRTTPTVNTSGTIFLSSTQTTYNVTSVSLQYRVPGYVVLILVPTSSISSNTLWMVAMATEGDYIEFNAEL